MMKRKDQSSTHAHESHSGDQQSRNNQRNADKDSDQDIIHIKKQKKEKKEKKEKDKHKNSRHHEKSHKHDKKDKKEKHKKHKKNKSDDRSKSSLAVNQNEFGKYGVIREENYHQKQREFEAYMDEVKGLPGILGQSKREIMKYFKDFMEDYNTATMPHKKYYNYEVWEMEEYQRSQDSTSSCRDSFPTPIDDETMRKQEIKRIREANERNQFELTKLRMLQNTDQRQNMKHQELLQTELQLAYKQGDTEKVKRLERLLAPEEEKATVKHPWS